MISKTLAMVFILVIFIFGCATQSQPPKTGSSTPPQLVEDTTDQDLQETIGELEDLQDQVQEQENLLSDAQETDDLQVLDVTNDLFE